MATVGQRGANSPVTHATLLESLELLSRSLDRLDMAKSDTEFAEVLRNLVGFLGASNAPGAELWARKLSDAQETHARMPARLAAEILGFYGGMGSLNDVVFRPGRDREMYDRLKRVAGYQGQVRRTRARKMAESAAIP